MKKENRLGDAAGLAVRTSVERYGEVAREMLTLPLKGTDLLPKAAEFLAKAEKRPWYLPVQSQITWDHRGRLIVTNRARVLAFDSPEAEPLDLRDLSKTVWSNVVTPEWARSW
ncbi:MAG: hypothetical protein ACO1SV_03980 [Fimbriimonas sp.]